ncbi:transposable element Tcb1 transposase [Trichonephila clavipes]|nr:transposable element Tcb1 transposase [Trichonephila clavipes]
MLNSCVMHRHTGPAPSIMVWGGIGYYSRTPLVRIAENLWSTVAHRLAQITPPAATPDQLWQRVEAAWSVVPQELIQSLFESMPRSQSVKNAPFPLNSEQSQEGRLSLDPDFSSRFIAPFEKNPTVSDLAILVVIKLEPNVQFISQSMSCPANHVHERRNVLEPHPESSCIMLLHHHLP